jgi:hypothetical protein
MVNNSYSFILVLTLFLAVSERDKFVFLLRNLEGTQLTTVIVII